MSEVRISALVAPTTSDPLCAVCVMLAKHTVLSDPGNAEKIAAAESDGKDGRVWIGWPQGTRPPLVNDAVTVAPCPDLGGAPVPLCWQHVDAMMPAPPPAAGPPPALGNGGRLPELRPRNDRKGGHFS